MDVREVIEILADDEQVEDVLVDNLEPLNNGVILRIAHQESDSSALAGVKRPWRQL